MEEDGACLWEKKQAEEHFVVIQGDQYQHSSTRCSKEAKVESNRDIPSDQQKRTLEVPKVSMELLRWRSDTKAHQSEERYKHRNEWNKQSIQNPVQRGMIRVN